MIHRIEEQLKLEGLTYPFDLILSEAIFAGNALLTVNGSTPYNSLYGRVPRILLGIDQIAAPGAAQPGERTILDTHSYSVPIGTIACIVPAV